MTGSEITIVAPQSLGESKELANLLSTASLIPDALKNKPADVLVTLLTGAELGLAPMQSMRGIAVIKGKPTLYADTMGALVRKHIGEGEYLTLLEHSPQKCVYTAKRRGDPQATTIAYTWEDATRAGLAGQDNYKRNPAAMVRARCLAAICRAVWPDRCLGLYAVEEDINDEPQRIEVVDAKPSRAEEVLKAKLRPVPPPQDATFTPEPPPPSPPKERRLPMVDNETGEVLQGPGKTPPKAAPPADSIAVDGKQVPIAVATVPQLEAAKARGLAMKQSDAVKAKVEAIVAELAMRAEAMEREFAGEPGAGV